MINKIDDAVCRKLAEHLLPLAETLYADKGLRDRKLAEEGWMRHQLSGQRKKLYYGDLAVQEDEKYGLELLRGKLGFNHYHSALLDEYYALLKARKLPSFIRWDEIKDSTILAEGDKKIAELKKSQYVEEIARFGAHIEPVSIDSEEEFEKFLTEFITKALPGFAYDKSMRIIGLRDNIFAITKVCYPPWKWVISIGKGALDSTYQKVGYTEDGEFKVRKDFTKGFFDINFYFCHAKNKRLSRRDQILGFLPEVYPTDKRIYYASHAELVTHLKYSLRSYSAQLALFDQPIKSAFKKLEDAGYAN